MNNSCGDSDNSVSVDCMIVCEEVGIVVIDLLMIEG